MRILKSGQKEKILFSGYHGWCDWYLATNLSGDKLGRTIGIPTANLAVSKDLIIPGDGIYAVKVHVNNQIYKGALSIGNRPVIKADDSRKIEVYIIDFNKNIYGELIEISIISKIRNQENYDSLEELRFQIDKDIVQITNILENA